MQCILIYHIRISMNISSYSVPKYSLYRKRKEVAFIYIECKRCKNTAKVEESQITIWTNIKFMFASGLGLEKKVFIFLS